MASGHSGDIKQNFVSTPPQARISAVPVSDDSPHLSILRPLSDGNNYYTLDASNSSSYFPRTKYFADKIQSSNLQNFLEMLEKRTDKRDFKVGFEARFGKIYWNLKSSGTLPKESSPGYVQQLFDGKWKYVRTDFIPEVQSGDLSRLLKGRESDKLGPEAITLTIKFFIYPEGPEVEDKRILYSTSISECTSAPNGFSIDAVYQEEYLDRVRVNFALPGRKYDMRISDCCKRMVSEEKTSVPYEVALTIANSLYRVPDNKLHLIVHGTAKNMSYWKVKFIRQRKETQYSWNHKNKWILACYNVDIFDPERNKTLNVDTASLDKAVDIPEFDDSRKEVELWGKHIHPNEFNKTQPLGEVCEAANPDLPPESDWTAESLMKDFDKFLGEAFQIAHVLDGSQQS